MPFASDFSSPGDPTAVLKRGAEITSAVLAQESIGGTGAECKAACTLLAKGDL